MLPPAMSTLPLCNRVAVCPLLGTLLPPVLVKVPTTGSHGSALGRKVMPSVPPTPPTKSTASVCSRVAVPPTRGSDIAPVGVNLPATISLVFTRRATGRRLGAPLRRPLRILFIVDRVPHASTTVTSGHASWVSRCCRPSTTPSPWHSILGATINPRPTYCRRMPSREKHPCFSTSLDWPGFVAMRRRQHAGAARRSHRPGSRDAP